MNYVGRDTSATSFNGIPSGFTELDRITGCWQPASLTVVAGAPSMGCTSLLLAFMRNAVSDFRRSTAFFSLQMPVEKLLAKWVSAETELPYSKVASGFLAGEDAERVAAFVKRWDENAGTLVDIVDNPNPTIGSIVAICKRLKASGTELFLIDNLNRIAIGKEARAFCTNREQELAYIIRRLKTLAYELSAPIIVVSQLSRSAATQGSHSRPKVTDLRDSGAIENEADMVLLLYRHEYYHMMEDEMGNPTQGRAQLIVAKNRFGDTDTATVQFVSRYGLFKDLEADEWVYETGYSPTNTHDSPVELPPNTIRLGSRMEEPPF